MREDVIRAHAELASVCEHIHLPLQSGSSRILKAMRRTYDRQRYLDRVALIREHVPDASLTTDIIVGFPGETEEDFGATLSLIEEVRFAGAFSFKYSPRPGTPAADMADQVPEDVKHERLQRLQGALDRQQAAFNANCLGRSFEVLFERGGRYPGQIVGRSPYLQTVQVQSDRSAVTIGDLAAVTVTQLSANSLFGKLAAAAGGGAVRQPDAVPARPGG
jgi:tRNA-2-methylthio-N6-dimethylallyladenosine synthase